MLQYNWLLLLAIAASILPSCKWASQYEVDTRTLEYESSTKVILGQPMTVVPKAVSGGGIAYRCETEDTLPTWLVLNESTCALNALAQKRGTWGPYTIKLSTTYGMVSTKITLIVDAPEENTLPTPTTTPAQSNYYMIETLAADSRYLSTFDSTGIYFYDMINPYKPNQLKYIATGGLSAGWIQAMVSVGSHIYGVTTTGHVVVFDWSTRSNPQHVHTFLVDIGGQNYDVASDGVSNIFIANTDNNQFAVVDVANPTSLSRTYKYDLGDMGAGVAYENGRVYVAVYGGQVATFKKDGAGVWGLVSTVNTSFSGAARAGAKNGKLYVPKYSGTKMDVFSLANPDAPALSETITVTEGINIYARPTIHDDELFLLTNTAPGKIYTYKVEANAPLTLANTTTPTCPGEAHCGALMGPALFRNDSFLAFVGLNPSNGNLRDVITRPLSLGAD